MGKRVRPRSYPQTIIYFSLSLYILTSRSLLRAGSVPMSIRLKRLPIGEMVPHTVKTPSYTLLAKKLSTPPSASRRRERKYAYRSPVRQEVGNTAKRVSIPFSIPFSSRTGEQEQTYRVRTSTRGCIYTPRKRGIYDIRDTKS